MHQVVHFGLTTYSFMAQSVRASLEIKDFQWPTPILDDIDYAQAKATLANRAIDQANSALVANKAAEKRDGLSIHPNPTSGTFSVTSATVGTFQLYNIHGAKIAQYHISAGQQRLSLPADAAPVFILVSTRMKVERKNRLSG